MDHTLHFPATTINDINNLDDVCQFFSELTGVFGLGWHPDHPFDTLHEMPGGVEESVRITSLMDKSFKVCETAGIEDPYELAYASTRKIREPFGIGIEVEEPLAALFR